MIRTLITIAFASFILAVACLAGAAALGGREIAENGWVVPSDWNFRVSENDGVKRIQRVGASERVTRDIPWSGGETLTVDLPADVTFVQGDEAKVVVEGPKDYVDRITVEDGRVSISGDVDIDTSDVTIDMNGVRILDAGERVRITVTAPKVTAFNLTGSGDLEIRDYDQPKIAVKVQGSGDVTGSGSTEAANLGIVGSGSIDLTDLSAVDAEVATSGSGDATIKARGAVKVSIVGSGGVTLRAKPASLTSEISGSGDVDTDY